VQSDPDSYKGSPVDFVAQVFTDPQRDAKGTYLQVYVDPKNSDWATIVAVRDPNLQIAAQDYVHVVGVINGKYTGKTVLGVPVTDPVVIASSVTKATALDAATPATSTINVDSTQKQSGVAITVSKVEFAPDETRVFVSVHNSSKSTAHFYDFDAKAVQGTHQFDANSQLDYPTVSSDILPGVTSAGVISFPAMNAHAATKLVFQAASDNYNLTFKPYIFHLPS